VSVANHEVCQWSITKCVSGKPRGVSVANHEVSIDSAKNLVCLLTA